jgi:hypothetical protein
VGPWYGVQFGARSLFLVTRTLLDAYALLWPFKEVTVPISSARENEQSNPELDCEEYPPNPCEGQHRLKDTARGVFDADIQKPPFGLLEN